MATKNTNAPIVNDTLIDWVIKEEGFLDKPTNIGDGKITLGSGLTAQKWRDKYRKNGNKWTKQDNRAAVREELESRKRWAEDTIPNWENLPDDTKRAMLSYKYNYDFDAKNSPKLFSAMKSGDYIEAVRQMDATSKDPKFKKGLQERRNREQAWGLGALIGSNVPIYQEVPPIVEYPNNTRVFNPYTPLFEEVITRPALVPANPTTNYVEARQAEPEEWQQDDALAAFRMLERARNYRNSMLWENQPELPQREYNPTEAPYLITRYDEGGDIDEEELDWSPESWFKLRTPKPDGTYYNEQEAERLASHVPEYRNIEREAKNNGTWLKMLDGTTWEGDPRSWVMMQSEAYKKNYSPQPWYTGQAEWTTSFDYPGDNKGTVETNKVTRAPYFNGQMWFSDNKTYGDTFAHYIDNKAKSLLVDPDMPDFKDPNRPIGINFLSAIPKEGNYRMLASPEEGTHDYWTRLPYTLDNNSINRLNGSDVQIKNDKDGLPNANIRTDGNKVLTDDVANWSKKLGDDGLFINQVNDGPVITSEGTIESPIINEFISQPGFTDKVKFIEGNTGDFDIENPYKYAYNNVDEDQFAVNYAAKGGKLEKKKTWDELSVKEKADMMRVAIENGITSLSEIKDKYNEFVENADIEETVENVNKSKADFVNRLKDANRQYIKDWASDGIATHKLGVGTDNKGNNYIYPEVQNINGKLVDFTRPPYLPYAGMISAEERGDTVRVPSIEQGVRFTENYKKYYPKGKTFAKGGHIYDGTTESSQQIARPVSRSKYFRTLDKWMLENDDTPIIYGGTLPEVTIKRSEDPIWILGQDNPDYKHMFYKMYDTILNKPEANRLLTTYLEAGSPIIKPTSMAPDEETRRTGRAVVYTYGEPNSDIAIPTIFARDDNPTAGFYDIVAELSHPLQAQYGNNDPQLERANLYYDNDDYRGKTRYDFPDTFESETHFDFQPLLEYYILNNTLPGQKDILEGQGEKPLLGDDNIVENPDFMQVLDSARVYNKRKQDTGYEFEVPKSKRIEKDKGVIGNWLKDMHSDYMGYPLEELVDWFYTRKAKEQQKTRRKK